MSAVSANMSGVAAKKSTQYPYQWSDGTWHSISEQHHIQNEAFKNPLAPNLAQITGASPYAIPAPPVGTYDPSLDYNAGAANRGFSQTQNDAQTAYEQGQQDLGLGKGDLTTSRDRNLQDIGTGYRLADEDRWYQTEDNKRQYGILGRQQAEGAAQRGITSQGLLGKSAQVRGANQQLDQNKIELAHDRQFDTLRTAEGRTNQDYTRGLLGLDLGNARTFGGFNGQAINNPLTGKPEFGSLITGVTRAGAENTAYQAAIGGQRAAGAQAMGYTSPLTKLLLQLRGGS